MIGFPVFVILTSRYVEIQQRQVLLKIKTIVTKKNFYYREIQLFFYLNRQLLSINDSLKEYSRFWSSYLTIALPGLVITLTYQLYFLTYNNNIPILLKYFFALSVSQLVLSLYLLIRECAQVVKINGRCLIENRKFYLKLVQSRNNLKASTNLLKVHINTANEKMLKVEIFIY